MVNRISISLVASDEEPVSARSLAQFATRVEAGGFHALYLTDHIAHAAPSFHSTSAFAVLAAATRELPLGFCSYILPYRHPIIAAKELAFLDGLCEGRLIAGLAVGSAEHELTALGVDFKTRGRLFDESLEAIRLLWSATGEASFKGEFFEFESVHLTPKPVQRPHPPIWFGSWTGPSRAAKRIVQHGAGWQSSGLHTSLQQVDQGWRNLQRVCAQAGRDPATIGRAHVNIVTRVAASRAQALAEISPKHRMHDELIVAGTASEVVEHLNAMFQIGIQELALLLPCNAPEQVDLIAAEVLPHFK